MHYLMSSRSQCPLKRTTSPGSINILSVTLPVCVLPLVYLLGRYLCENNITSCFVVLIFSVISHAICDIIGIMGKNCKFETL